MNISPPRATADRNVDSVPKTNARIRKRSSRNSGSWTRRSTAKKAISEATPAPRRASTRVEPHPTGWPPAGRMPYVIATMIRHRPSAKVRLPSQSIRARRGSLRSSRRR